MSDKPNILIFLVDQMRADMVRANSPCIMPTVKRLAREGVQFTETYTPSPHCCPSRASFMTGRYPTRHGVWNNVNTMSAHQYGLTPGITTYATELKKNGYITAYAGKVHVSNNVTDKDLGWDWHRKLPLYRFYGSNMRKPDKSSIRRHGYIKRFGWPDQSILGEPIKGKNAYRKTDYYHSAIKPGIEYLRKLLHQDKPWCLCISTDMDHGNPTPAEFLDLYDINNIKLPDSYYAEDSDKPNAYTRYRRMYFDQLTENEIKEGIINYYALCTMQDKFLDDILTVLDNSPKSKDTVVIFVGDHGDYLYEHGMINMGFPSFKSAYHVPAIMRWPNGIRSPGRTVDSFVSLVDFAPTFCELGGGRGSNPGQFSGSSLVPFIKNRKPSKWRDKVFHMTNGNESYFTQRIINTKKWRYVMNWFDFDELYDLENDPGQTKNLLYEYYRKPVRAIAPGKKSPGPWPYLPENLEKVRKDLITAYWNFAIDEEDMTFNRYYTAALTPYGAFVAGRKWPALRSREMQLAKVQKKGILR